MKALLRDYLSSLREREELDSVLPDLLSELGYTVFSRPQRGTAQRGVDIGAVGPDARGERKVHLFSVKQGDLGRQDWDGTPQALRSSLNQIRDVYIRNRLPIEYRDLGVVICVAIGGDVREQVRDDLKAYFEENATSKVTFEEWNGDKIAGLLLQGVLREELLPKDRRSRFQKAVAMVDVPDVSFQHFATLVRELRDEAVKAPRTRVRIARQVNICLWVLFVWARDVGNLEAAYRASELAVLSTWDLFRPVVGGGGKEEEDLARVLTQVVQLHLTIVGELLEARILPQASTMHALSASIESACPLDVNLAMFEMLGRLGLAGVWMHWLEQFRNSEGKQDTAHVANLVDAGFGMIESNPALLLPIKDRQAVDIALFLQAWLASGLPPDKIAQWLTQMVNRLDYAVRTRGRYPCVFTDYQDLLEHPRDRTDDYLQLATSGSSLIPLISAWLRAMRLGSAAKKLEKLVADQLPHCTLQLWLPDAASEERLYAGEEAHGRCLPGLSLEDGGDVLIAAINEACKVEQAFEGLSAIKARHWPIVLLACKLQGLPIPPQFWIGPLSAEVSDDAEEARDGIDDLQ